MSDSGDTDDLLLIPPDFFIIDSDFEDPFSATPYFSVVDNLISQVSTLESRIKSLESSPQKNHKFMSSTGRTFSSENLKINYGDVQSTQSTPQKPRTIFKLNSLPNTPNMKHHATKQYQIPTRVKNPASNIKGNPYELHPDYVEHTSQKTKMFNDIDEFISNVNTLRRLSESRNVNVQTGNNQGNLSTTTANKYLGIYIYVYYKF